MAGPVSPMGPVDRVETGCLLVAVLANRMLGNDIVIPLLPLSGGSSGQTGIALTLRSLLHTETPVFLRAVCFSFDPSRMASLLSSQFVLGSQYYLMFSRWPGWSRICKKLLLESVAGSLASIAILNQNP